jgi:hypothetical protein
LAKRRQTSKKKARVAEAKIDKRARLTSRERKVLSAMTSALTGKPRESR